MAVLVCLLLSKQTAGTSSLIQYAWIHCLAQTNPSSSASLSSSLQLFSQTNTHPCITKAPFVKPGGIWNKYLKRPLKGRCLSLSLSLSVCLSSSHLEVSSVPPCIPHSPETMEASDHGLKPLKL
jgi:hypothetical protein